MTEQKLTDRTALTSPADGDLIHIVDVSDTTDSADGTSKKITKANLVSATSLPTGIDATKIADGSVSNTEFQYLNGATSAIQTQIDGKQDNLAEGNFVDGDKTKLDGIEALADVTDATNVESAGAVMDSELIATSAGASDAGKAIKLDDDGHVDATMINDVDINLDNVTEGTTNKFFTTTDESKLSGIEDSADVTDADNVNAVESDPIVGAVLGIVKADGLGAISAAVEDTDYQGVLAEGAFADGDKSKLDGIESGAEANTVDSVNTQTGAVSLDIDDVTPTTTKGDIIVEDGSNAVRLPVGDDTKVLSANSATATGLEWVAAGTPDAHAASHESLGADEIDITGNMATAVNGADAKTTPADDDEIGLIDSAASYVLKKLTFLNLKYAIGSYLNPIGTIREFNVSTNPATLLGFGTWTAYGTGRVTVAIDAGDTDFDTVDETGGAKTHTLTVAEMPKHSHDTKGFYSAGSSGTDNYTADNPVLGRTSRATELTGGGGAHNNVQPYIVVYRWVRTA